MTTKYAPCLSCGADIELNQWHAQNGVCEPRCLKRESPRVGGQSMEGGRNDGRNPGENPGSAASSEPEKNPEKPRPKAREKKQHIRVWLFIWGEVEQQRLLCGDLAAVLTGMASKGAKRGGHSLQNSLLIHADLDGRIRAMGAVALNLFTKVYVNGWEWEEAYREGEGYTDQFGKVHKGTSRPTGRYYRRPKPGAFRTHHARMVDELTRQLAESMDLEWREEKKEEKKAA